LCKFRRFLCAVFFVLAVIGAAVPLCAETPGTQWYRSNASGMALESLSRSLALRETYALSVERIVQSGVPPVLQAFLETGFSMELRVLWRDGEELRRLWVFRDGAGLTRVSAAFNTNPFTWPAPRAAPPVTGSNGNAGNGDAGNGEGGEGGETDGGAPRGSATEPSPQTEDEADDTNYGGYIEVYNDTGFIAAEHRFDPDRTERITRFVYTANILIRADTQLRRVDGVDGGTGAAEPYATDHYYYTRAFSLRAVERIYHSAAVMEPQRLHFPHRLDQAATAIEFKNPRAPVSSGYLEDLSAVTPLSTVLYTTDRQGRVLSETRRNEAGEVTGELRNNWSANRLDSMEWIAGEDVRRTEYEYNGAGDRIIERNFRNGELERLVRREGDRDIEELYRENRVILRAVWEDGLKISEERIRGENR
jgi:hypothetical protein